MNVVVNGKTESIADRSTVAQLIHARQLEPVRVAVEINEQLVRRGEFDGAVLQDGDRIEIVTLVAGG